MSYVVNSETCFYNGNCTIIGNGYECLCNIGYSGGYCEITPCQSTSSMVLDSSLCSNEGTCFVVGSGHNCSCNPGYSTVTNPCDTNTCQSLAPCQHGASCAILSSSPYYDCSCTSGYYGYNCSSAYCQTYPSTCQNGAACNNMPGLTPYYNCTCLPGYYGYNCSQAYCQTTFGSTTCQNGATCVNTPGTSPYYQCNCQPGYYGTNCTLEYCSVYANPCLNGGSCVNTPGSGSPYTCNCAAGYNGINCTNIINNCLPNPCQNGGNCTASIIGAGTHVCACINGFSGYNCTLNPCITYNNTCYLTGTTCAYLPYAPWYTCVGNFISTWNTAQTTGNNQQVALPLLSTGYYSAIVSWGDGTFTSLTSYTQYSHAYASTGTYTITINGTFQGFDFHNSPYTNSLNAITSISQFGVLSLVNNPSGNPGYFYNCANLAITASDQFNLTGIVNMNYMFAYLYALTFVPGMNNWNVSLVQDMSYVFSASGHFNTPIGNWNTGSVTSMLGMFSQSAMFNSSLTQWNTANVVTMYNMFSGASAFNQNISYWNTGKVTNMQYMFFNANNFNQPLYWNTSSVTSMYAMFNGASSYVSGLIGWNTANVLDMSNMFNAATVFNDPNIGTWNTGSVTSMGFMFFEASAFNQNIGGWNTASLLMTGNMFFQAFAFNQPIGTWNVASLQNIGGMFAYATSFNQPLNNWNTISLTYIAAAFEGATAFNQPLNLWNTAQVNNMNTAFYGATSFNQNLSTWNVLQVTDMGGMFDNTALTSYNYDSFLVGIVSNYNSLLSTGIHLGAANIYYQCAPSPAAADHTYLTATKSWTITDAGCVPGYCEYVQPSVCQHGGMCTDNNVSPYYYTCSCPATSGYYGQNCTSQYCSTFSNPCQNGGTCNSYPQGGSPYYNCSCPAGYYGYNCTQQYCSVFSNPCQNGGTCNSQGGTYPYYNCACLSNGYYGTNCTQPYCQAFSNPCQNGGTCNSDPSGGSPFYNCSCLPGYTNSSNNCSQIINNCAINPCLNGGICNNVIGNGTYTCSCQNGYGGVICGNNPCIASNNTCYKNSTTCTYLPYYPYYQCTPNFIFSWSGTLNGNTKTLKLPLMQTGGYYSAVISWGDGTYTTVTSYTQNAHTYAAVGVYNISINGTFHGFDWTHSATTASADGFIAIYQWGVLSLINQATGGYFVAKNLAIVSAPDLLNTTGVTSFVNMFENSAITSISNIQNWNVASITDMTAMFRGCNMFIGPPGTWNWNTGSVTSLSQTFFGANVFNTPLNWNYTSVTTTHSMFESAITFNSPLIGFTGQQVTDMIGMFDGAISYNDPNLVNWNTGKVTSMLSMFNGAHAFNQPIGSWNTASVTSTLAMFENALAFNQNLSQWNIQQVSTMANMFDNSGLNTTNYDAFLIGIYSKYYNTTLLQSSITLGAATIIYDCIPNLAATAHNYLTNVLSWTINDAGCTSVYCIGACSSGATCIPQATFPYYMCNCINGYIGNTCTNNLPNYVQNSLIVPTDYSTNAPNFGTACAMSYNGTTMAITGILDGTYDGSTWIYNYNTTTSNWVEKIKILGSTNYAEVGQSVAISGDGSVVFIGATDALPGASVFIYTLVSGTTWTHQTTLTNSQVNYGKSIAIGSTNNNVIAVGCSDCNGNVGITYIYTYTGGSTWVNTAQLIGSGNIGQAYQGKSSSFNSNGTLLAVGGNQDNNFVGACWIFTNSSGGWIQVSKLVPSDANGQAQFGSAVSMSYNGQYVAIGGNGDNSNIGATWVFQNFGGGLWIQVGTKMIGTGATANAHQGFSVSFGDSTYNDKIFSGGWTDNSDIGATWLYVLNGTQWVQYNTKIVGSGNSGASIQGSCVSLSQHNNRLAIGGAGNNGGIGAVWVFNNTNP